MTDIKAPESMLEKFIKRINEFLEFLDRGGRPVSVAIYVILGAILFFVIIKLLGLNYQTLFIRKAKTGVSDVEVFDEDIHGIDFEKVIQQAIDEKNYRKAVRYMYIRFLKILSEAELIEWQINKTNKDYRKEMSKSDYFKQFKDLTYVYEYVWYGEFSLSEGEFHRCYEIFHEVSQQIR
jgi:hypothetical protein